MNYIINSDQLTLIADAIRGKTGKVDTITVDEMPDEISGISGGGSSGTTILSGTSYPSNAIGANGDIYLRTDNNIIESVTFQRPVTMQLDYYCNENSVIEFDCSLPSPTNTYDTPFGSRGSVDHFIAYNDGILRYLFSGTTGNVGNISEYYNKRIKITLSRTYCKMEFEGSEIYNVSFQGGTSTSTVKLGLSSLFTSNNGSDLSDCRSNVTFYGMKIYENGILVRDYVPYLGGLKYYVCEQLSGTIFQPIHGDLTGSSTTGDTYYIKEGFVKMNSEWVPLLGADIDDINISVTGTGISILSGTTEPDMSLGNEGDFYMQYYDGTDLPEGYSSLRYIEVGSTAGPYIDTGLTSSADISCEISLQLLNTPTTNKWFYGAFSGSKGSPILGFQNGRFEGYIVSGGAIQDNDTNVHTFLVDANGISVDGSVKQTGNWSAISVGTPLYLFARGGDIAAINNTRIFYCKQWNNGTLVRHLIPARRNSDSAIGMFDIVNNEFHANQGTGSFDGSDYTDNEVLGVFVKDNDTWQEVVGTTVSDIASTGTWTISDDYNDTTDKPSINSVTLAGNKTNEDLGIQSCIYDSQYDEVYTIVDGMRIVLATDVKAQALIPVMTNVNIPEGLVESGGYYGYGQYGSQNIWNAFDGNDSTYVTYQQEGVTGGWISYEFANDGHIRYVTKVVAMFGNYKTSNSIPATLYVYDEDDNEIEVATVTVSGYTPTTYGTFEFTVNRSIKKLKFVFGSKVSETNVFSHNIQAYGWVEL